MNPEEIRHLLEKYYDGESTGEEENLLKVFFSQTDIPEDLLNEKEIFNYYVLSSDIPEPSPDFETRIISVLDSVDRDSLILKKQKRIYRILTGIAAGLLILIGSYFLLVRKSEPRDTFSDPRIAYAETMKILYNVSVRFNDGTKGLEPVGKMKNITEKSFETINKPAGILEEKMKPLDRLNKVMEVIGDMSGQGKN